MIAFNKSERMIPKDSKLKMEQYLRLPIRHNNPVLGILVVLLLVCFPFSANAVPNGNQEQKTVPEVWIYGTTTNWHISQNIVYCDKMDYWVFRMTGVTEEIEGRTYNLIESAPPESPTMTRRDSDGNELSYALGVRREGGRVYVNYKQYLDYLHHSDNGDVQKPSFGNPDYIPYYQTEDGELVLYDYNMKVGDKYCTVDGFNNVEVTSKDSVTLADSSRRCRLTLSNGLVLIEGLGCVNSNGRLLDYLNPAEFYENNFTYLVSAIDKNGELLYKNTTLQIMESEGAGIHTEKEVPCNSSSFYDLHGRRLTSEPTKGMYIKDGRKMMK